MVYGCTPEIVDTREINEITIGGSGSGATIIKLVQESFESKYPGRKLVFLSESGTGAGVKAVSSGVINLGSAARKMKQSEKEMYPNVIEFTYVKDAMVLGVHKDVAIESVSKDQIKKIFTGEITNWNKIGDYEGEIVLLDREESESSKILLRTHVLGDNLSITDKARIMISSNLMNRAIAETSNSIGQTSLGVIHIENLQISAVAVAGIMPSIDTIRDERYEMVRNYGILILKENKDPAVQDFVEFLFSEDAQKILEEHNFLTVPQDFR